jgi:hypothetical protein
METSQTTTTTTTDDDDEGKGRKEGDDKRGLRRAHVSSPSYDDNEPNYYC